MNVLLRVLLVEDNPGDADLITELLSSDGTSQFEVECVARLSEALERVGADRFDILLLDLGLPDSDELGTLRAMRRHADRLPIVVLTGNNDARVALAAIQEGAQDYLVKGQIDYNLLVRSIKYSIERKQSEEKLRESREMLQLVMNNIPQFVFWKDTESVYLGCNEPFARAVGLTSPQDIFTIECKKSGGRNA